MNDNAICVRSLHSNNFQEFAFQICIAWPGNVWYSMCPFLILFPCQHAGLGNWTIWKHFSQSVLDFYVVWFEKSSTDSRECAFEVREWGPFLIPLEQLALDFAKQLSLAILQALNAMAHSSCELRHHKFYVQSLKRCNYISWYLMNK